MEKTPVYFVPGLAASPKIFEHIDLPLNQYELFFLKWKAPLNLEEPLSNYALRMCQDINHKNPVLIGVSFGGVMVQEMSKHIKTHKTIIISSIKHNKELPTRLTLAKYTKVYKLFPTHIAANIEKYKQYFWGKQLKKKAEMYEKYLSVRNENYLKWGIFNVLNWNQNTPLPNIFHIHGETDTVFPIKYIEDCIEVKNGNHAMILTKAKIISTHIHKILTC